QADGPTRNHFPKLRHLCSVQEPLFKLQRGIHVDLQDDGDKIPGRSGSGSSNASKASSSPKGGVVSSTSGKSVPPSSQDICSSSGQAKVNGSDKTTPVMPLNPTPDPLPSTKRQVKRRVRRRRESAGATGCSTECIGQTQSSQSRSQKQTHTLSESSSDDEEHRREARSWIRQKARRKRSCSRHTQTQQNAAELVSVNSDEAQKENQPPSSRGAHAKAHKKLRKEERRGKNKANPRTEKEIGSKSEEEEPITKMYEEQGSGDPDMATPSPCKCSVPPSHNGASQQVCTDDELEVCRICHCEGDEECPLITPCRCTGTLSFVHQGCLNQWIKSSDTSCCELCKYEFIMETHLKPLRTWEKLQMSTSERRKIFCSVAFHLAAVVCAVWSLCVLIARTTEEIRYGKNNALVRLSLLNAVGVLDWPFWTKLMVVAAGFFGGLIFMYIQCKVYLQLWRRLKAFNRIIFVQNCPDSIRIGENRSPLAPQRNGTHGEVEIPVPQTQTNGEGVAVAPV
ncbi:hypothetical protein DNTS_023631, partial [Danionella cerebrum]